MKDYFFLSFVCVNADAASFFISRFDKVLGAFSPFAANRAIPGDVFSFLAISPPFEERYKKTAREHKTSASETMKHIAPTAANTAMAARVGIGSTSLNSPTLTQTAPHLQMNLVGAASPWRERWLKCARN